MKQSFRIVLVMVALMFTIDVGGCGAGDGWERQYVEIHQSARLAIPAAVEMESLYGAADHFITYYGMKTSGTNTWNTDVFFGGRYRMQMQVPVRVNYSKQTLIVDGEPTFYLFEYTEVDLEGAASVGKNFRFSQDEWEKVCKAKGDLTVIGIVLNPNPVVNFDKLVEAYRRPRIPISLIDR
jgi:hypothetical protein